MTAYRRPKNLLDYLVRSNILGDSAEQTHIGTSKGSTDVPLLTAKHVHTRSIIPKHTGSVGVKEYPWGKKSITTSWLNSSPEECFFSQSP